VEHIVPTCPVNPSIGGAGFGPGVGGGAGGGPGVGGEVPWLLSTKNWFTVLANTAASAAPFARSLAMAPAVVPVAEQSAVAATVAHVPESMVVFVGQRINTHYRAK
jgi:hypothetical protein